MSIRNTVCSWWRQLVKIYQQSLVDRICGKGEFWAWNGKATKKAIISSVYLSIILPYFSFLYIALIRRIHGSFSLHVNTTLHCTCVADANCSLKTVYTAAAAADEQLLLMRLNAMPSWSPVSASAVDRILCTVELLRINCLRSRAATMTADYMTETVLFIVLSCSILVADRPDSSSPETSTQYTVSQCIVA